jgi:hypothetical protein
MRKGVWHGLLTGLALLLAACGGGGQPQPDLSLAGILPQNPTVVQGQTLTLTLTFTSQNGFQGPVSLSVTENGQPPSWLTLSPPSATLNVPKGGQVQVNLQAQVAGNAPTGPHALKIRASYGDKVAERDLTLTVNAFLRATLDWTPLAQAAGPDGSDGPIALSGTLEGTPSAPLKLQVSYRPKGGDWGPWQEAGQVQVQGGQITATLPGLELPVGLDELGKGVRVRLVAGDQALAQSPELLLQRFQPLWRASLSEANSPLQELSAAGSLACGYWDAFDGVRRKLYCFDPATGNPTWSYDLPLAPRDVFVAGDGRVFVGGYEDFPQARVLVLQGGTLLAQYDLSADFAVVTALALEGDTLYVGGSRYVQAPCGSTTRRILRVRFAKYRVAGSFLTRLALHDPTPQDLQEITSPNGCTGSGDDYSLYNWSGTPALRLEGGKVYAVFSVGEVWTGSNFSDSHCLGFLRLDAATFARDWLTRPTRQGANGEASWSRECSSSWTWFGWYFYIGSAPVPVCWYAPRSFDLDATRLFASSTGSEALLKETGGVVPVPGRGGALLFLPGFPEGLVRFPVSSANRLLAYPGGTEGPYVLNLEVNYEYFVAVFKDPEGRVYAYSDSTDLVVRLR